MSIRVYVAGGWRFRYEIKTRIHPVLIENGLLIHSTWIECENGKTNPLALAQDAIRDFNEINTADVVFAVMNHDKYEYRGTFTEIGYAIASGIPVVVWCPGYMEEQIITSSGESTIYTHKCMTLPFFHHPSITRFQVLEDAISYLTKQ